MNPSLDRGLRKATRTLLQLIASGGLLALVNAFADGLAPESKLWVLAVFQLIVTFAQNTLETAGTIPVLLPSPPIHNPVVIPADDGSGEI